MKRFAVVLLPVLLAVILLCVSCTSEKSPKAEPEGYRVIRYVAATHEWTILRTGTFDGKYLRKRLTVRCSSYSWGQHDPVNGPEACHLEVGRLIVPNSKREEFLDVYEMPGEILSITEGTGADRVIQQFDILKYEVLPDNANP